MNVASLQRMNPRRKISQITVKGLLCAVLVVAILSAWFAARLRQAERQRRGAEAIVALGGTVRLDYGEAYEMGLPDSPENGGAGPAARKPWPDWLRNVLGDDFFFGPKEIVLSNIQSLKDEDLATLAELPSAKELYLHYSPVTDVGLQHLQTLNHLKVLALDHTNVSGAGLRHLEGLSELRVLSLNGTAIPDESLRALTGLPKLEELYLDDTKVTNAGLKHLTNMQNLSHLSLKGVSITDDAIIYLRQIPALETLNLQNVEMSDKSLSSLKEAGIHVQSNTAR